MARVTHLGKDVWILQDMPFSYTGYNGDSISALKNLIPTLNHKILIAITADAWQQKAYKVLEKTGFEKFLRFKSSHSGPNEFLTLWVKETKSAPDSSKQPIGDLSLNCTVTQYLSSKKLFTLLIDDGSKDFFERFERVRKTPIGFKVAEVYIKNRYDKKKKTA